MTRCGRRRCAWCSRPLGEWDLRWFFGEAEAALGVRSSHGALVNLALSGVRSGGGGDPEAVVRPRALEAAGRHACLRAQLARVSADHLLVLSAVYGPQELLGRVDSVQARHALGRAFGELLQLVPLTSTAAERKLLQAATTPAPGASSAVARLAELVVRAQRDGGTAAQDVQRLVAEAKELLQQARQAAGVAVPVRRRRSVQQTGARDG